MGYPDYDPHSGTGEKFAEGHRVDDPMSPSGDKPSSNDRSEENRDVVETAVDEPSRIPDLLAQMLIEAGFTASALLRLRDAAKATLMN